jgi:hypothetical protein
LAAAQKATRPSKPESLAWEELKEQWRADARGLQLDRAAHQEARAERTRGAVAAIGASPWLVRPLCARGRAASAAFESANFAD